MNLANLETNCSHQAVLAKTLQRTKRSALCD